MLIIITIGTLLRDTQALKYYCISPQNQSPKQFNIFQHDKSIVAKYQIILQEISFVQISDFTTRIPLSFFFVFLFFDQRHDCK
jgi:hypothetical protein